MKLNITPKNGGGDANVIINRFIKDFDHGSDKDENSGQISLQFYLGEPDLDLPPDYSYPDRVEYVK